MSLFIATFQEVRDVIGLLDSNTAEDTELQLWLEALQSRMETYCRRGFEFTEGVEEFFDGGGFTLDLYRFPVTTVTSVHVDQDQDWESDTLLDADDHDYLVRQTRGRIYYGYGTSRWPEGIQHIRVVYSGGLFGTGNNGTDRERETVRRAYFMQARYEWKNRDALGVAGLDASGASVGKTEARLLPDVRAALNEVSRMS